MPVVGRTREFHVAANLIGSGSGCAALFLGESGSGKTTFAREVAERHEAALVTVSPSERMWPRSGLTAVASGLDSERGAAIDSVLERGRDWPEHLLAEEISRTLHLLRPTPYTIVVDDLDEMDSASATVLSYVFGRLRGTGLSVIATGGSCQARQDFAGMVPTRIHRLSFDEAVLLAGEVLGSGADRAVVHIVAELSAGHPGILSGVRLTPAEAAGDAPLGVPLRLRERRTDARARRGQRAEHPRWSELLDLLAVGPVYGLDRLRATARASDVDLDDLLDDGLVAVNGELARLADPVRRLTRHAGLSPDERRRLHARAAADHAGAYPATRRWHESFLDPDADRGSLLSGAASLARDGETAAAVEMAERALSGRIAPGSRAALLVDLGDALILGGHDLLGQHYLRRAGTTGDPAVRTRAAIARLRAAAAVDHVVDDSVLAAVAARGDGPAPAASALDVTAHESLLCASACLHLHRGEVELAARRIEAAVESGVASTQTTLLAGIVTEMGARVAASVPPAIGDDTGAPGESAAEVPVEHALLTAGLQLLREDYAAARQAVRGQLDRSPRPAPLWREQLLRQLATIEVRAGDPDAARDAVAAWRREWPAGRSPDAASMLVLAAAAALQSPPIGAADLAREGGEHARREGVPTLLPWFAGVEGAVALAEGRFSDAVDRLRAARRPEGDDPALHRSDADLIEALWLDGRRDEARQALTRLERAAATSRRRWTTLALARSRAVCRSDRDGAAAFHEAEEVFRSDDAPYERNRLRTARARCLPDEPERVIHVLERTSPADDEGAELTAHEREIVALVERGLRNREIAATLFISLRTVELRLTGIYRKLGITSRVQLVAQLRGAAG